MKNSFRIVIATLLALASAAGVQAAEARSQSPSRAEPPSPEQLIQRLKRDHPRLLIDRAGFEELRNRVKSDATLRQWEQQLRREAESILRAPLPRHELPDGLRLLGTSRLVLTRAYTLAMVYRLHGERRYLDRLWKEMDTVAGFPDFNPRHFLDTAEMTHALAIAYDWLFDAWSAEQRERIRGVIVGHGLKPGLSNYRSGGWWPRSIHNWNQVCNGGMTAGALAIADEEPQLAGEILHAALASLPLAMASYAPDGAWGEGPGYWNYATTYNVVMLAMLESALGTDFGLSQMEGFSQTGLFPIYMTGPTDLAFNFADSGERFGRPDILLWLGQRFNLPACTWFAATGTRHSARALLWYREPGRDPQAAALPLDKYWRNVEVVTMRSQWNDPQALFVGIQAGSNRVNHNHLDLGSFVLDALGHRWAVDLGPDNYNLPGFFGRQRYTYYRLRAEGHNTLVLNPGQGPDQDPAATARILRFESTPKRAFALAELTPAYAKHAQSVRRGVAMLERRAVLVQDEVSAKEPVEVWWFMHTPADVSLSADGRTATLKQGKASLAAQLLEPAGAHFEVRPASPLPCSPDPKAQARNERFRKLALHLPEVRQLRLAVLFVPQGADPHPAPSPIKPLAEW